MRNSQPLLCAFASLLLAAPAFADYTPDEIETGLARCAKSPPVDQIRINACFGYSEAKAELQLTNTYRQLRALLKKVGAPGASDHLLKVQRAWIAYREAACESYDRGTSVSMHISACMGAMADARTSDLKSELQNECDRSCDAASSERECRACGT